MTKIPRFQLEKFPGADPRLATQMKSVGEVMAIGRTFKESLGKALRSLELDATPQLDVTHLRAYLANPTPERINYVFAALRHGFTVDEIYGLTYINRWFLGELAAFIDYEATLREQSWAALDRETLYQSKAWGFSDRELAELFGRSEDEVRERRRELGVHPVFKMVDTCAAEFEAATPYFYSTYGGAENEARTTDAPTVMILGSGPNRIGQGIEFDYANVHAVWALQEAGYEVVMVNSNPETVSTDYDIADRLYFEPLTVEDVSAVVAEEQPKGIVVGFGGQTPLKLAGALVAQGTPLLGSTLDVIELAENREAFGALLDELGLQSPPYGTATTIAEALQVAERLGYPVLVRPSYVLGGRAMEVVDSAEALRHYVEAAARVSPGYPVLIDRFLENAVEIDVDVVSDGADVWVAGLMEQIEEAGIHSGDSACVLPPVSLGTRVVAEIEDAVTRLVRALGAVGLVNVQLAVKGDRLYVLEANPRASRTVPFVSKAIGVPVAKLAAKTLVGETLRALLAPYWPYPTRDSEGGALDAYLDATHRAPTPWPARASVKEVVLPFGRFSGVDVLRGPEMRSTGEVMSFGENFPTAYAKAQIAAGNPLPEMGTVLISLADPDKREGTLLAAQLHDLGFDLVATKGTARALRGMGVPVHEVHKVGEGRPDVVDLIAGGDVQLVVNTPSSGDNDVVTESRQIQSEADKRRGLPLPLPDRRTVGYRIRTAALAHHIPYVTTLVVLRAVVVAIRIQQKGPLSIALLGR